MHQRMRRSAARRCPGLLALLAILLVVRPAAGDASVADVARAEARLASQFASRGVAYPPASVTLVALKSEGRLELWADGGAGWRFVKSYLVQATSGWLGPKLREGDHQVPEGIYRVNYLNPQSPYHLSLHLDYPNAFDEAHGLDEGRDALGGDIVIHGNHVSDGCLAVGDDGIEELFAMATQIGMENVGVIISPVDLRRVDAATAARRIPQRPRWLGELYAEIARALQPFAAAKAGDDPPAPRGLRTPLKAPRCRPYDAADCERQCRAGDVASCTLAGIVYRDGRGVHPDAVKAWTLLTDACKRGDALGCSALSDVLVTDDGMRRDTSRAATLARAACDAGDGHGCAQLASLCTERLIYSGGPGVADECSSANVDRLRHRAIAKLKSLCSGWAAYDCFTLATIYALGDPTTARRYAAGSCEAGDPGGCDELGELLVEQGEIERARPLFDRACRAGYARACEHATRSSEAAVRGAGGG